MNTTESDENRSNYLNWQGLIIKAFFIGNANSQDSNGSLQLNLEETQNDPPSVSLLQPSNFSSPPTSHQPHTKCVEKLREVVEHTVVSYTVLQTLLPGTNTVGHCCSHYVPRELSSPL